MLAGCKHLFLLIYLVTGRIPKDQGGGHGIFSRVEDGQGRPGAALLIHKNASRGDRFDRGHACLPHQYAFGIGDAKQSRGDGSGASFVGRQDRVAPLKRSLGVNEKNESCEAPQE
jgi:hypothetical protein